MAPWQITHPAGRAESTGSDPAAVSNASMVLSRRHCRTITYTRRRPVTELQKRCCKCIDGTRQNASLYSCVVCDPPSRHRAFQGRPALSHARRVSRYLLAPGLHRPGGAQTPPLLLMRSELRLQSSTTPVAHPRLARRPSETPAIQGRFSRRRRRSRCAACRR